MFELKAEWSRLRRAYIPYLLSRGVNLPLLLLKPIADFLAIEFCLDLSPFIILGLTLSRMGSLYLELIVSSRSSPSDMPPIDESEPSFSLGLIGEGTVLFLYSRGDRGLRRAWLSKLSVPVLGLQVLDSDSAVFLSQSFILTMLFID